jgi:class 3 adenylate cyclase
MAETNATILIPDISGFTEFMTSTELGHASHAINMLIDAMLEAVGDEYEVSEIEGDALLLIKKGPAPTKKEIFDTCIKIFNAFHFQRKWMQQHTICACGACQAIIELSLKFVAHHGPLAEIKIGKFVKQSGPEMIVAHRLLKNSINNHEYLLLTEKLVGTGG